MKKIIEAAIFASFLYFIMVSCAQIGSPVGGPKDSIPPIALQHYPPNFSTHINTENFKAFVRFDEYIQLKNFNEQFYISPATNEPPEILIKGKKLIMEINDSLKSNMTYTLWFANSVCDFNEYNPIEDFMYVFSTGDVIDTLSVSGYVYNAFNLKDEEKVWVMAYRNLNDSTPLKQIPDYMAKTDTAGAFTIKFMAHGRYKMFAMKDMNANFKFDSPTEELAFLDSSLVPNATQVTVLDTLKIKSDDGTFKEEIVTRQKVYFTPNNVQLFLFKENTNFQRLETTRRDTKSKLELFFKKRLINDSIHFELLDTTILHTDWRFIEKNYTNDSLNIWLIDSALIKKDTIRAKVEYFIENMDNSLRIKTDTIVFSFKEIKLPMVSNRNSKQPIESKPVIPLEYSLIVAVKPTPKIDLNRTLQFVSPTPVKYFDESKIRLEIQKDTLWIPVKYEFYRDSSNMRSFHLKNKWAEGSKYKLFVDAQAFMDYYGAGNDTIEARFMSTTKDDYGKLILTYLFNNENKSAILQLVDAKDTPFAEYKIASSKTEQKLHIEYLKEKNYKLKLFIDENGNGKWDTGNYIQKKQPEKVVYHINEIAIKAKWDTEIKWDISKDLERYK